MQLGKKSNSVIRFRCITGSKFVQWKNTLCKVSFLGWKFNHVFITADVTYQVSDGNREHPPLRGSPLHVSVAREGHGIRVAIYIPSWLRL